MAVTGNVDRDQIVLASGQIAAGASGSETFMGGTVDGITVRRETEWFDHEVDQHTSPLRKDEIMVRHFVATNLVEATLENLAFAYDLDQSNITGNTTDKTLQVSETRRGELSVVLTGEDGLGKTRTYTFSRCVAMGTSEHVLARTDRTVYPIEFECLIVPSTSRWFNIKQIL